MKKNIFKKSLVAITAALMMTATTIPVSAADTYTITIDNTTPGHTYQAYQIFTGSLTEDENGVTLSGLAWGNGVDSSTLGDASTVAETLTDEAAAKAFAKTIAGKLTNVYGEDDFDDDKYEIPVTQAGYYLIVDKADSLNGTSESYTSYILRVVDDVTATPKSDVPTIEKKVQDTNDTDNTTSDWQDSADYDIGDSIPFEITVTLPSNVSDYNKYKIVVTDTFPAGLTYDYNYSIKINGVDTWCSQGQSGNSTSFTIEDIIAQATGSHGMSKEDLNGATIVITYTATLNENAVIGGEGNENTVSLTYSNNPNSEMNGSGDDTGTTPEDKVVVFTYNAIINKVDENNQPLTGATFKLEKNVNGQWTEITRLTVDGEGDTFTFKGLDDGDYRLTETNAPAGYNPIDPVEFTISATHDTTSDDPTITELTSTLDGAVADKDAGTITATIKNEKGSSLPSTGGIGTTIFFVSGGILVAVAGIILIIKKRMNNAD